MARGHGRILTTIWSDPDFRDLDPETQRLYMFLLSQPNLDHAGVLPITLRRWSTTSKGLKVGALEDQLEELDRRRFVVMDHETEELLVRTYIRNDNVFRQPKVMLAAVSAAQEIVSTRIRLALLAEMDRLPLEELPTNASPKGGPSVRYVIDGCLTTLRRTLGMPDGDPDPKGLETVSERVSEALSDTQGDDLDGFAPDESEIVNDAAAQDVHGEGSGKGIGNPHACAGAHSPAPAPAPAPAPLPPSAGGEPPATGRALELVHSAAAEKFPPTTTDELIADWIDHVPERPPGKIIGRVGKEIKILLAEGINPVHVRAGLAAWARKGSDPSALASFVNQAMNAAPNLRAIAGSSGDPGDTEAWLNRFEQRHASQAGA